MEPASPSSANPKPATDDIGNGAARLLETLRDRLAKMQPSIDPAVCAAQEAEFTRLYDEFFKYAISWAGENRKKYIGKPDAPESIKLKKKAGEVLQDLQSRMKSFLLCTVRLQRTGGFIGLHIRSYLQDNPLAGKGERIKWTGETGMVLARYRKERAELESQLARFRQGLEILQVADKDLIAFQAAMQKAYGADKAEDYIRSFRSGLRMGDFAKAGKILASLSAAGETVMQSGKTYIEALEKAAPLITGQENKLFLAANEIQVVIASNEQELAQKIGFIEKYRLAGMENKQAGLAHLRDRLLVIGSLDSLMTLYIKLMRGLALPMNDAKAFRDFESNVLDKINYLMGSQFQEIEVIEQRNKELLAEFFADQKDYQKGA